MQSLATLFLLLLAASVQNVLARTPGCGKTPPSSGTKNIGDRQYILQIPANYNANREYRLVFGFHWLGGNMGNVAPNYYGLRALAEESTIFVAPNGLNAGWANSGDSDITFVDQILAQVQDALCVDETQRFATGFSYGGAMSNALACARPNIWRAVSVIAGARLSGCSGGTTPVAYLGIHGVIDSVLPISNGHELRDRFLRLNGCAAQNAPEPPGGSNAHIKTEYSCREGFPVWWIAHGGDHVPEHRGQGTENWIATETWTFFTQAVGGGSSPPPPPTVPPTTPPAVPPTTPPVPPPGGGGNCAARWAQCGGQGWSGATCCQSGSTCRAQNQWYSQCL
ncbi:hypothetical protein VD0002_g3963 [Verticillium dahliae]|uniref:Feruloyl esterase C n=1 Tax=Verticillium dahliae TaxID=27337 RepID=A0AA44WKC1_VERDA|nr:hypothetical protein VdG2_08482 [Verticillium dahliae VDG2]KAH6705975.1 ferulic acid esterase A [Verticillium dahliae]PNH33031.1 hypothetical protein BJF96_g3688 [Verticillium dahliae]PNH52385.1 hypothetical protein VD0003_g4925 [Verticillium dahliae]PNH64854.1 hypothetical protein VD0002_g3963 [Verticillium dahliae]